MTAAHTPVGINDKSPVAQDLENTAIDEEEASAGHLSTSIRMANSKTNGSKTNSNTCQPVKWPRSVLIALVKEYARGKNPTRDGLYSVLLTKYPDLKCLVAYAKKCPKTTNDQLDANLKVPGSNAEMLLLAYLDTALDGYAKTVKELPTYALIFDTRWTQNGSRATYIPSVEFSQRRYHFDAALEGYTGDLRGVGLQLRVGILSYRLPKERPTRAQQFQVMSDWVGETTKPQLSLLAEYHNLEGRYSVPAFSQQNPLPVPIQSNTRAISGDFGLSYSQLFRSSHRNRAPGYLVQGSALQTWLDIPGSGTTNAPRFGVVLAYQDVCPAVFEAPPTKKEDPCGPLYHIRRWHTQVGITYDFENAVDTRNAIRLYARFRDHHRNEIGFSVGRVQTGDLIFTLNFGSFVVY